MSIVQRAYSLGRMEGKWGALMEHREEMEFAEWNGRVLECLRVLEGGEKEALEPIDRVGEEGQILSAQREEMRWGCRRIRELFENDIFAIFHGDVLGRVSLELRDIAPGTTTQESLLNGLAGKVRSLQGKLKEGNLLLDPCRGGEVSVTARSLLRALAHVQKIEGEIRERLRAGVRGMISDEMASKFQKFVDEGAPSLELQGEKGPPVTAQQPLLCAAFYEEMARRKGTSTEEVRKNFSKFYSAEAFLVLEGVEVAYCHTPEGRQVLQLEALGRQAEEIQTYACKGLLEGEVREDLALQTLGEGLSAEVRGQLLKEIGRRSEKDAQWGREHCIDDLSVFQQAVGSVVAELRQKKITHVPSEFYTCLQRGGPCSDWEEVTASRYGFSERTGEG